MIVCHCNVISSRDIRRSIADMRKRDPHALVTPGEIFKACGKRPNCGGCMTVFAAMIEETVGMRPSASPYKPVRTRISDATNLTGLTSGEKSAGPSSTLTANGNTSPEAIDHDEGAEDEGQCEGYRISQQVTKA